MRRLVSMARTAKQMMCAALVLVSFVACRPQPRVIVSTRDGTERIFRVEIADTPAKRELGLQFRQRLDDDQGMLFLFPDERPLSFWMKDTPLSLDIVFIGSKRIIVGIVQQAVPFSTQPLSVPVPSQFVLEVKGGVTLEKGMASGDSVRFEGIDLNGVRE
ncbi:MAG: DUF192 domain-containing protein [Deltaproteobacteria bacterium]|nr:DUF192 domain-containing protein [Deltaproteobacteria bacterium]